MVMMLFLKEILPPEVREKVSEEGIITVPSSVFSPHDPWTQVFMRGRPPLAGRIHEVGVGSGAAALTLALWQGEKVNITFSDLAPGATVVAEQNIRNNCPWFRGEPIHGPVDLLKKEGQLIVGDLDAVIGCIPQVPKREMMSARKLADYYNPDQYFSKWNTFGLGLIEALLHQAQEALKPRGRVLLTLAGRTGRARLLDLFQQAGYEPEMILAELVRQDQTTSLASLREVEKGLLEPFEFFSDASGKKKISAEEAEIRRKRGKVVYHYVYVICGTKRT